MYYNTSSVSNDTSSEYVKNKFYWKELQVKHSYTIYKLRTLSHISKTIISSRNLSILGIKINVFVKFIQIRIKLKPFSKPFQRLNTNGRTVHMSCLYCATCSTGSVTPEYFVAKAGIVYFLGTSMRDISSTNGDAWNPVLGSTSTGTAAP
ncbi:hypothetical protein OSB04_017296, partial [Centaurea solstitialis]